MSLMVLPSRIGVWLAYWVSLIGLAGGRLGSKYGGMVAVVVVVAAMGGRVSYVDALSVTFFCFWPFAKKGSGSSKYEVT